MLEILRLRILNTLVADGGGRTVLDVDGTVIMMAAVDRALSRFR